MLPFTGQTLPTALLFLAVYIKHFSSQSTSVGLRWRRCAAVYAYINLRFTLRYTAFFKPSAVFELVHSVQLMSFNIALNDR